MTAFSRGCRFFINAVNYSSSQLGETLFVSSCRDTLTSSGALLGGATGRPDPLTPSKALLGHWVVASSWGIEIHRCYSPDGTVIFNDRTQNSNERLAFKYKTIAESPTARTIQVQMDGDKKFVEIIAFSANYKSALVWTKATKDLPELHEQWKYVDSNSNCR